MPVWARRSLAYMFFFHPSIDRPRARRPPTTAPPKLGQIDRHIHRDIRRTREFDFEEGATAEEEREFFFFSLLAFVLG